MLVSRLTLIHSDPSNHGSFNRLAEQVYDRQYCNYRREQDNR